MIVFDQVTKMYGSKIALHPFTWNVRQGGIVGLIGENGSGKSTILKLMCGLLKPSKGSVTLNSQTVTRRSAEKVAYLSELDAYYSGFTVSETIDFFSTQFPDFDRQRAYDVLSFMNLDGGLKVKELSKGNRSRMRMAITLGRNVPYILLDEPFSGMDPMVRESIIKGLLSFVDIDNQTIIITTHEIADIEPLLDEVIVLKKGKVIAREDVATIHETTGMNILDWFKKLNSYEEGK
ncbi:ABC transporter ATP-binding protein [Bacillus sp. CGMCC 1.16607]|uniref:ABC transporter ATP-binding protein n=1 Tax=Bacillus sp. CGMCC 1.16607 TaxID=3351842 RepID=UPI0036302DF5